MTIINEPMKDVALGAGADTEAGTGGSTSTEQQVVTTTTTKESMELEKEAQRGNAVALEETKHGGFHVGKYKCCGCFQGHQSAIGYNILGLGRGGVVMANIFLAAALIYLACDEAGGIEEDGTCDEDATARGMKPSALVSNIIVLSGLLSALFMPFFGAIIDYTDHRKLTGILSAVVLVGIQAVQIGTTEQTWFAMAILQALAGFIYQVQVLSNYAYLPEIAREVGQGSMNNFTAIFTQSQFLSQAVFNIVVIGISVGFSMDTVHTAMAGQTTCVVWGILFFPWGWKLLPARPARHQLQDNQSLLTAGFSQNWKTTKAIWTQYRKGLKWFLLALIFAEASAAATTNVAVIYLSDVVGLNVIQIGIFFLVALIATIPGAKLGSMITHRTNPNLSWKLSQITLCVATIVGALLLENMTGAKELSFIWAFFIGLILGWFYPCENLFFSMCLPKGQEAELAGFFVYCTQILGWLPPLLFSILVQNNVSQKWGVVVTSFGYVVAVLFLMCTGSWEEILAEAEHNKDVVLTGVDDTVVKKDDSNNKSDDEEIPNADSDEAHA